MLLIDDRVIDVRETQYKISDLKDGDILTDLALKWSNWQLNYVLLLPISIVFARALSKFFLL